MSMASINCGGFIAQIYSLTSGNEINMRRIILLAVLLMTGSIQISANMQSDSLIYVGDPMCSWCYGFSPVVDKLISENQELEFILVMGGLRINGKETMFELKDFLKEHWEEVAHISGQTFDYSILEHDLIYDTAPACKAVVTAGQISPEKSWQFFKTLQSAFYAEGKNPASIETFLNAAIANNINPETFRNRFEESVSDHLLQEQLAWAADMGVHGFPTLLYQKSGKISILANGYDQYEKIKDRLDKLKQKN